MVSGDIGIILLIIWCACAGFLGGMCLMDKGHTFSKDDIIKAKVAYHDKNTGELKLIKLEGK